MVVKPDYTQFYNPNRTRVLRDVLASKNWRDVYLIAKQIQQDMAQLELLAQAEMAQDEAERLIGQLNDNQLYMVD